MFLLIGIISFIYIVAMIFAGVIVVGLTILTLVGFILWAILKRLDEKKIEEKSKAEVLREMYDMMIDKEFIKEVEEGSKKFTGYRKKYNDMVLKYGDLGDEEVKQVYERLVDFWSMRNIEVELVDSTVILLGGYTLVFREKEVTSIQRERNITRLIEEEIQLEEVADRDRLVQGEVVRIVNGLKGNEEEIRKVLVDGGNVSYRIDQGGLGTIEERNMVGLIKYMESWVEEGVGVDIVIEEDEQKVKFYIDSSRES